jgi:hypothetical protein
MKESPMAIQPSFDVVAAHKFFAADCFNKTWDLMDKAQRTPAEDEQMLFLTMASAWHWSQRADCTDENRSVAYWQIARVYTLLKQTDNARRYGQLCLEASQGDGVPSYCLGYAYEALARAEMAAGDHAKMAEYVAQARAVTERMQDAEAKKMILDDLATIV